MNTMGSYKCGACQKGYYGNPYVECKGIRYCSEDQEETNPCDKNAQCISKHFGRSYECAVRRNLISSVMFSFSSRHRAQLDVEIWLQLCNMWTMWCEQYSDFCFTNVCLTLANRYQYTVSVHLWLITLQYISFTCNVNVPSTLIWH